MSKFLIEQFTKCYDQNGWFVAIRNALEGMTPSEALWKPAGGDNCVWETLSHLTYYNHAYLERFKGLEFEYDVDDNDATFTAGGGTDQEWAAEIGRFDSVMTEFRELLERADPAMFDRPVSESNRMLWGTLMASINAHNAYHGGQILLLRKLQGSWDRAKGVS